MTCLWIPISGTPPNVGVAKRRATKILPKRDSISAVFSNLDKYRPEVAGDVISGWFVRPIAPTSV